MNETAVQQQAQALEMRGAYASLAGLLQLRFAARELKFVPRKRQLSRLAGHRDSNFRGRGIEFEEVRRYQAGDELRAIDWRVTARTGEPHTRLYREERERPTLLLIDQRQAMFFGSRQRFKSVQALNCAAALAWAALAGGDRVGGLVSGAEQHHEVKPRRNRRAVLRLLELALQANHALRANQRDREALAQAEALRELRRIARPGSAVLLLSDFHDWDNAAREQLALLSRHCEVTALQLSDPLERELPPPGRYRLSDGEQSLTLDSRPRALREGYRARAATRREALRTDCRSLGVPLIQLGTEDSALAVLRRYYGQRRREPAR